MWAMTVCNKAALSIPKKSSDWPEEKKKKKKRSFNMKALMYFQSHIGVLTAWQSYLHLPDCYFWYTGKCLLGPIDRSSPEP